MRRKLTPAQRKGLIEALVADWVETVTSTTAEGDNYAKGVAEGGFVGYKKMTDTQLIRCAEGQGLEHELDGLDIPEVPASRKRSVTPKRRTA